MRKDPREPAQDTHSHEVVDPAATRASAPVAAASALVLELQRTAGNRAVTGMLQRDTSAAPSSSGPPAAPGGAGPVGDASRPEVEGLLSTFASASGYDAKNAAGIQAVRAVIAAYSMSTKGLRTMRFKPDLNPKNDAETGEAEDNERESVIEFGPGSFPKGFAWLVHITAHELEHVRQNLIGAYHRGDEVEPVSEFLAYNGSVLQVQSVPGPAGKGLLGALATGAGRGPGLPPLPPDLLADQPEMALAMFSRMPSADQKKPQYRQELAGSRDKLLERLTNEAPRALQPPRKFTPEWTRWAEGKPPSDDPFTIEYQDWADAIKGPWEKVRAVWKKFDANFKVG